MRITFITGHLCKERSALLNELALDLGEYGAEVTVLTGFPSRRISADVRKYYLEHPIERISENVTVKRVGSKNGEGKGLLIRMIKYAFLTMKLYKEAKKTPTDVYYLYSSPPFLGYIGGRLSKIAPTVYNAQDLFPDTLIHMKNIRCKNPLICWLRNKEKQTYNENSRIITISLDMKKTILDIGCDESKIDVIYNWADVDNLHHVEKKDNRLLDELGIDKDKFIISYAGNIGLFQGWDVIIDAAKLLMDKNENIQFAIIGSGAYKENILSRLKKENITNVHVFPLQSSNRLPEIYSLGDMELVPIEKGITRMALPSKTGVIMSCGSPVLALVDKDSDIANIINKNNIGVALEHGSPKKLAEAIIYCYENKEELGKWGCNARNFAELNYARNIQTKKYFDIIKGLCSPEYKKGYENIEVCKYRDLLKNNELCEKIQR